MPPRSPTKRGGPAEDPVSQLRTRGNILASTLFDADEELLEMRKALSEALEAKNKMESDSKALKQLMETRASEQDATRKALEDENRTTLRKCSELAQELASERQRSVALSADALDSKATAASMRATFEAMRLLMDGTSPAAAVNTSSSSAPAPPVPVTVTAVSSAPASAPAPADISP